MSETLKSIRFQLILLAIIIPACIHTLTTSQEFDNEYVYFIKTETKYRKKVLEWQKKQREEEARISPVSSSAQVTSSVTLRVKYNKWIVDNASAPVTTREEKWDIITRLTVWLQSVSQIHYISDGKQDTWPTLSTVLEKNGDDCDGLDLLGFLYLRGIGFTADEIQRGIIKRLSDGQHHMITFWFEDRHDPWVIDQGGAVTSSVVKMSELTDWIPVETFDRKNSYNVIVNK